MKAGRLGSTAVDQAAGDVQPPAPKGGRAPKSPDKQNRILLAILRSMSAGVVVAHKSGKFLLFNPEAERIFGVGAIERHPPNGRSATASTCRIGRRRSPRSNYPWSVPSAEKRSRKRRCSCAMRTDRKGCGYA